METKVFEIENLGIGVLQAERTRNHEAVAMFYPPSQLRLLWGNSFCTCTYTSYKQDNATRDSQEKDSAEIRGEFFRTNTWVNFAGGGLVYFRWKKLEDKIHPKIHSKIQMRLWEFRGQNPHCKNLPLKDSPLETKIARFGEPCLASGNGRIRWFS